MASIPSVNRERYVLHSSLEFYLTLAAEERASPRVVASPPFSTEDHRLRTRQEARRNRAVGQRSHPGDAVVRGPEQAAGKVHALDARTDVHALGAILYECLTGRPPFRAATALDTLLQVLNDEPVPVRVLQAATPPDLETICLKCLHKEPGKRYATARELADDLGRFLGGEPVVARPVGRLERGWRWCKRNPTTAGLLTGIALLLVTVATFSTVLGQLAWRKAEDERRVRLQAVAAQEEAKRKAQEEAEARKRADAEEANAKRLLYTHQLARAQSLWEEGKVQAARDLLDEMFAHRDTWEHRYLNTL
jgi:hypothetical protein